MKYYVLGREEVGDAFSEDPPVLVRGLPHDDCVDVDGREHHDAERGQMDSGPHQTVPLKMAALKVDIVTLKCLHSLYFQNFSVVSHLISLL